jgi:hypothetical protein
MATKAQQVAQAVENLVTLWTNPPVDERFWSRSFVAGGWPEVAKALDVLAEARVRSLPVVTEPVDKEATTG